MQYESTMTNKTAAQILDAAQIARRANRTFSGSTKFRGMVPSDIMAPYEAEIIVTYHGDRTYEVGTSAKIIARGGRAVALAAVEGMLSTVVH